MAGLNPAFFLLHPAIPQFLNSRIPEFLNPLCLPADIPMFAL